MGVAERADGLSGTVHDAMFPLDDPMLVSGDEPLMRFLPLLAERPFRLVVMGARIQGIVTRSDVLKLPVYLLAFTLITHLKMVMARLIPAKHPDDDGWIERLSPGRRTRC